MQTASYPTSRRNTPFFCIRFQTHALRSGVCLQFGNDAFAILVAVASGEDRVKYKRAPLFWWDHFLGQIKISRNRLNVVLRTLVAAGWLHYEPGHRTAMGRFWVLVPGGDEAIDASQLGHTDDDEEVLRCAGDTPSNTPKRTAKRLECAGDTASDTASNTPNDTASDTLSIPVPVPIPNSLSEGAGQERDGGKDDLAGPLHYDDHAPDWGTIEANFVRDVWNPLKGSSKVSKNAIPRDLQPVFRECWQDPHWRQQADLAMAKFRDGPFVLSSGDHYRPTLKRFLTEPSWLDDIVGGTYDRVFKTSGKSNGIKQFSGDTHDPARPVTVRKRDY